MDILQALKEEKEGLSKELKQLAEELQQTQDFSNLSARGIEIQYKKQLIDKTIAEIERDQNFSERYYLEMYQKITESLAIDRRSSSCSLLNYRNFCIRLAKQDLRSILEEFLEFPGRI